MTASFAVPSGRAKWYAPNTTPDRAAPALFAAYIGSTKVRPSVALANANRVPEAATSDQSIVP